MDQRKALFRSKLREAQKREKRIDSPLVRYNESDQPICKICNVILKSESHWPAHQVSKKHHEAINNLKASAGGLTREKNLGTEQPKDPQKSRLSSTLPADFFDNQNAKRHKIDSAVGGKTQTLGVPSSSDLSYNSQGNKDMSQPLDSIGSSNIRSETVTKSEESSGSQLFNKHGQSSKFVDGMDAKHAVGVLPKNFFDNGEKTEDQTFEQLGEESKDKKGSLLEQANRNLDSSDQTTQAPKNLDQPEAKQVKGALPEGFFDNKDADLRARGIEPVKVDVNDVYKVFEKEIQGNLQEVDDRLEEEEIDAAEEMEGYRSLEHKAYKEKVDEIKKKLMEVKAERIARAQQRPAFVAKESSDDESSSDDGDDDDEDADGDNFAVDWRAQHL